MCGIAGIVTSDANGVGQGRQVEAMQRALAHRGPDGSGVWVSPAGMASFAHTRLAIIDATSAGQQPMSTDDGRLTITFNGAIYNHVELRRELQLQGASFRSHSDTEVILRAYERYGDACVDRLRGMFAFAIWDERARRCMLARDHFGIKPLYYAHQHDRLIFASELRAIVASGLVPRLLDARATYEYFRSGSVQEPRTLLAGVKCLGAGRLALWDAGHLSERCYWDLSFRDTLEPREAVAATREALSDSVARHFTGDVPVGVFLSGGVDSTAILALAKHAGREVCAMTMAMPGVKESEHVLAHRTARYFGVRHEVCEVDASSGKALFADYWRAMDQPSIDGMNTLAVSRLAEASGMKVMLSGLGADELFGGYPSVQAVPKFDAWNRRLASAGPLRRAAGRLLERAPDPRLRRVGDMLNQPPALSSSYATYRGIFTRAEAATLTQNYIGHAAGLDDQLEDSADDPSPQDAACRMEITRYMRNQLLRDTDVMSMSCGIEIRVPYIDTRVVTTLTRIPHGFRLREGKALLRDAVPEIPDWVAQQPKRGFMLPVEAWLRDGWKGVFDEVEARSPVSTGPWYRKWCVRAFEEWLNRRASID